MKNSTSHSAQEHLLKIVSDSLTRIQTIPPDTGAQMNSFYVWSQILLYKEIVYYRKRQPEDVSAIIGSTGVRADNTRANKNASEIC